MKWPGPRISVRVLMIVVVIIGSAFAIALRLSSTEPRLSEIEIHMLGEQLAARIEAWRAKAGNYPSSLREASLYSPTSYAGGFTYQRGASGFRLQLGVADGWNYQHVYTNAGFGKPGDPPAWTCRN